ncbi:MAG: hypothetical protein ACAH06_02215 [Methylophilaceae bacterium]
MIDPTRAAAFLEKAQRYAGWLESAAAELQEHGIHARMADVERVFAAILSHIASLHDALIACAKKLGIDQWHEELDRSRKSDQLLFYLWMARDSETHDAIVKWRGGMRHIEIMVIDSSRANAAVGMYLNKVERDEKLLCYVYGVKTKDGLVRKMKEHRRPSQEKMDSAGVRLLFALDSLALSDFKTTIKRTKIYVAAPESHMGEMLPPSAHEAVRFSIRFYKKKLAELVQLAPSEQPQEPPSHGA